MYSTFEQTLSMKRALYKFGIIIIIIIIIITSMEESKYNISISIHSQ